MNIEGIGSEGAVINGILFLGLIVKLFIIPWVQAKQGKVPRRRAADTTGNPGNPNNGKPGRAEACIKHTEKLAKIWEAISTIKRQISKIFDKLDEKEDKK